MTQDAKKCAVVIGNSGIGKSTFLNETFGTKFPTGDGDSHVTTQSDSKTVNFRGELWKIIDTKGNDLGSNMPHLPMDIDIYIFSLEPEWNRKQSYHEELARQLGCKKEHIVEVRRSEDRFPDRQDWYNGQAFRVESRASARNSGNVVYHPQMPPNAQNQLCLMCTDLRSQIDLNPPVSRKFFLDVLQDGDVREYRQIGDAHLLFYLTWMNMQKKLSTTVEILKGNDTMKRYLESHLKLTETDIRMLCHVQDDQNIQEEHWGDVLESVVGKTLVGNKKKQKKKVTRLINHYAKHASR